MSFLKTVSSFQPAVRCLLSDLRVNRLITAPLPEAVVSSPFDSSFYKQLLVNLQSDGVKLTPLPTRIQKVRTLALRHDIDSLPAQAKIFLNAEKQLGIHSAYYFIVDSVASDFPYTYKLEHYVALVQEILAAGSLVGIHSIAWSYPNGIEMFYREQQRFKSILGIEAEIWTHHGFKPAVETKRLRAGFEIRYFLKTGHQFTQARMVVLSDSAGRSLPKILPATALAPNFPNEFLTHSDYWNYDNS